MPLSVLVISYNAGRLRECLDSLVRQPEAAEIIVSDCSDRDPAEALAAQFPSVRFLHFAEKRSVPQLRWTAFRQSTGSFVAAIEARTVPAADWCAALVRCHLDHPDAPVVGGPVALAGPASARDEGLYFCEYGMFAPPIEAGAARELSGANLSYRREDLERAGDLLDAGRWETPLHERWRAEGRPLVLTTATVFFENALPASAIVRQRFAYGRGYAATRMEGRPWVLRAGYAACCPLLPALLTARLMRSASRKGLLARVFRSLPWMLLFHAAWSAGEAVGYLAGPSGAVEIY